MSSKGSKYIERKNIPDSLSFKEEPQFNIRNIENKGENILLHYIEDGKGMSIYMDDHEKFQELPTKIEILSGGWYNEMGKWSPLVRYVGTIICENIKEIKQVSEVGKDYSFKIKKSFFSNYKTLIIESEKVGVVKVKCMTITPQPFEKFYFDKKENKWVLTNSVSFK